MQDAREVEAAVEASGFEITEVVSGGAAGVDALGEAWARRQGLPVRRFEADWDRHKRFAGHVRNTEMAAYADALIAVWDGTSRGTRDMIALARRHGLRMFLRDLRDTRQGRLAL